MPVTYRIVGFLKRSEQEDYFDRETDFTPFSIGLSEGPRHLPPVAAGSPARASVRGRSAGARTR
jgi:hypothetical protein